MNDSLKPKYIFLGCCSLAFFVVFLFFIIILVAIIKGSSSSDNITSSTIHNGGSSEIAVIPIKGEIFKDPSTSGGNLLNPTTAGAYSSTIISSLKKAQQDNNVKAVILDMDTPGGDVVASSQVNEAVKAFRKSGKPVVTVMGDLGASGGYYIAVASNKIVADPNTITGSIGVITQLYSLDGLYQKLGIQQKTFKSGQFKDESGVFTDDPQANQIFQNMINEAYNSFVNSVAQGRNMSVDQIKQLADGRPYTGTDAQKLGLIDYLGGFDKAVQVADNLSNTSDPTIIEYNTPGGFLQNIFSSIAYIYSPSAIFTSKLQHINGIENEYILN